MDFGEALAVIGGIERKIHFFAMDLPHSDAGFVQAYPAETTEAFCAGHVAAFAFFGGVPASILDVWIRRVQAFALLIAELDDVLPYGCSFRGHDDLRRLPAIDLEMGRSINDDRALAPLHAAIGSCV